ncbi:hypothetical protein BGZ73_002965 [Actinomortierella ambigua]|nr:hypothetical protein BGZ73_002965 [Actinomortierella ambigua]
MSRVSSLTSLPDQPSPADHHPERSSLEDGQSADDSSLVPPAQRICRWAIYAVHALCAWDERLYEFASYVFLFEIFKATLLPPSIYGFMTTVAGILLCTSVGTIVDRTPRLQGKFPYPLSVLPVRTFLVTQKLCGIFGGLGFWALLTFFDPTQVDRGVMSVEMGYSIFCFLVVLSSLLKLSALGWSISIERDWIVVLCEGDSHLLTRINASMKRIDLVCKLCSPLALAGCLAWLPTEWCSLLIAAWCAVSLGMEWLLVLYIWNSSSALWEPRELGVDIYTTDAASFMDHARKHLQQNSSREPLVAHRHSHDSQRPLAQDLEGDLEDQRLVKKSRHQNIVRYIIMSFGIYCHHAVFLASLAYGMIYINLMSVSGTMIGYLQWRGFSASSIAVLKGVCTTAELLGTIAMPILTYYVGLVRAGSWSIWFEVLALTPVVLAMYSDRLPIQVIIFAGMALSRIGVWSFDLVITQIMQEHIENDGAGAINGWHYTMMNTFELAQFVLTMIWHDPQQYLAPALISYGCVVAGAMVYAGYLMRMRGHLFHYRRLATSSSGCHCLDSGTTEAEDEL